MLTALRQSTFGLFRGGLRELQRNWKTLFQYLLLTTILLLPHITGLDTLDWSRVAIREAYVFLAVGLFLLAIISRVLFFIFCLPVLIVNVINFHLFRHWGRGQLASRVEAYYESPPGETIEYLRSHVDEVGIALLLVSIIYLIFLTRATFRGTPPLTCLRKLAGIAAIAWLAVFVTFQLDARFSSFPPYKLVKVATEVKHRYDLLGSRRRFLQQHPVDGLSCPSRYDKVVIVLGESASSDHMSVFGYARHTTPFVEQSQPYVFNAIAPSNQTRFSIPMMLSDASPGDFNVFYTSHSLVGRLRACGFNTLWISNQGRRGPHDSFVTSLAFEAHEQIFLNQFSYREAQLDADIINKLQARQVYRKTRQATFIHLIGSHDKYSERFPDGFGFTDLTDTISEYDNSILYTDYILSELYKRFYNEDLLFIYISDHGEVVSNDEFGHGYLPAYKEEYRIPLLIWTEDAASIAAFRAAIGGQKFNADSFDHLVLFLIGASDELEVSTSEIVSVLSPERTRAYSDLRSFGPLQ